MLLSLSSLVVWWLVSCHCLKGFGWCFGWSKSLSVSDSICDVPVSLWMTSRKVVGILPWGFLFRFIYVCAHVLTLVTSWLQSCSTHLRFIFLRLSQCVSNHCELIISSMAWMLFLGCLFGEVSFLYIRIWCFCVLMRTSWRKYWLFVKIFGQLWSIHLFDHENHWRLSMVSLVNRPIKFFAV